MATTKELTGLLREIVGNRFRRRELIERFQQQVWNATTLEVDERAKEILVDLAYDLDFYERDQDTRAEDRSFYSDQTLEKEIEEALSKLEATHKEEK